ncbi:MAG: CBO0543 family protein, partial [Bacillota bacterium]|nr:CBO0543 family protein [Bacillota bacterium]
MEAKGLLDEVYKISAQDSFKLYNIWITQIVFSWRWWFEIGLTIIPWIVWLKIRNKKDTARLLFVGSVVAIVSNMLDIIGGSYNLWHYDWKDFPFVPIYLPWDFTLFPVSVMIMLQF